MKTLIIYDSQFGNTEKIAKAIGEVAGEGTRVLSVQEAKAEDLAGVTFAFVGSPTHGGRPSQPLQGFIHTLGPHALQNIKVATFDTGIPKQGQKFFMRMIIGFFGYAAKRTAATVEKKGAQIAGAETFYVLGKEGPLREGEIERAKEWAREILK